MRIVHVIPTLDMATGGPARVAVRLPAAQRALGHDVEVVSYASPHAQAEIDDDIAVVPNASLVRWTYVRAPSRLERLTARNARQLLNERIAGADLVYLHGIWPPIILAAAKAARAARVPYAVIPHGMLDPWSLAQRRMKKRVALMLGYRSMLDHAAFLHVLNSDEGRLIEPLRLRAPQAVIPNGIFLDEVDPLPRTGDFRKDLPALGDAPYVLFLSRLHYKKGLDVLADAFIGLEGAPHLVVAGPDGGAKADLERRIAAHPDAAKRVHIVGSLQGRARFAAMVDAHCFCLPSRQEGFSMAITEALATGTAAVISEECHFPEVADVGAGLVVALSVDNVKRALAKVLAEPSPRVRYGEHGRKLVAERFTWNAVAEQTLTAHERYAK